MKRIKALKSVAATIMLFIATTSIAPAQEVNHHVGEIGKGPHGGTIQEADPYHGEIIVKNSKVYFYLLDDDAKPVSNKGVTVKALLQFNNSGVVTESLRPSGTDGFIINNPKAVGYLNCIVTVTVKGKTVSARFKNYGSKTK
jgi:hypothetical protein